MQARDLMAELRNGGAEIHLVGSGHIEVSGNLNDEEREAIRTLKPELLQLLAQDERRNRVLQMMADDDQLQTYYFWPDTESSRDYVILACAKRGVATWDMTIEREKWDAMKFLELVEKMQ